ncbi:MAG: hypothetical protein IT381_12695 [Deltaproteobacteria bacterium]|nr:hypothetical protein [Deltaproteobacteria bacterium]
MADAACLTPLRRQARPIASGRPAFSITVASATGLPFVVHGPAGSTATLNKIRDAADAAWQAEIVQGGWPAPPPDNNGGDNKFDIYIDPSLGEGEAFVDEDGNVTSTAWNDRMSFMCLPPTFADDAELKSLVSHELNHASQYALDGIEDDAFFEQTATLVEKLVGKDVETYSSGIEDFQKNPARALDFFGDDLFQYGGALWLMFLTEALDDGSDKLAKRLWVDGKENGQTNEPDFLDVLPAILHDKGWTTARFFATFAIWRYFTGARDDGAHFEEGGLWGSGSLVPVGKKAWTKGAAVLDASLSPLGIALFELPAAGPIAWTAANADGVVAAQAIDAAGKAVGDVLIADGASGTFAIDGKAKSVVVALTRVDETYDPDDDAWDAVKITVKLTVGETPKTGDVDVDGDGDGDGDGEATATPAPVKPAVAEPTATSTTKNGCNTNGTALAWPFVILVALRLRRTRTERS